MSYKEIAENRLARMESRITRDLATGCWNWDRIGTPGGYGIIGIRGRRTVAHRGVWELLRGPVPEGMDLDHLCRNRLCVNPDHLEVVTRSTNLRRGFEARGCKNGHAFNHDDFSIVRRADGVIERRCKACHRERNKRCKK
jgi:hypothetical protein